MSSRREFLERSTGGVAALGAWSLTVPFATPALPPPAGGAELSAAAGGLVSPAEQESWDVAWTRRVTGKHKGLFDATEIESGLGVWRAHFWFGQYQQVFKAAPADISPVIVLRHNAILLALQQSFWDKYGIGKRNGVMHPMTMQPLTKNPALLGESDGIPAALADAGLPKQLERGVVALACNLALQVLVVPVVKQADNLSDDAARKVAVDALIPGVILQPSGVFACILAQEAGCAYVKAS